MLNRSKALAAALLGATFILGAAAGAVGVAAWTDQDRDRRPRQPERLSFVERLARDLDLTATQRDSVATIVDRRDDAMREVWRDMAPRFDSLRDVINQEILAVLDEEQQAGFEAMLARADSARRHRDSRGGHERTK
jgi:Spy/CpxP family protein refolding chaperone